MINEHGDFYHTNILVNYENISFFITFQTEMLHAIIHSLKDEIFR